MLQNKCMWQVTTIIQPALRHLGISHFWKVLYIKIPKGQIRWPIFLFFMYMLVLKEKTSIFPKSNMFWILVFSCPKMTLISIFTRMTHLSITIPGCGCNGFVDHKGDGECRTRDSAGRLLLFSGSYFHHHHLTMINFTFRFWCYTSTESCPEATPDPFLPFLARTAQACTEGGQCQHVFSWATEKQKDFCDKISSCLSQESKQ